MEEGDLHRLPPSKRFKLLQQHESSSSKTNHSPNCLPAKKRIDSHHHHYPVLPTTSICLPAKKRVWAPCPLSPIKHHGDDIKPAECSSPKPQTPPPQSIEEDDDGVICSVCGSTDGDPQDPIVFCDGCDLMVHASCYGDPLIRSIPEGDWFCLRCETKGGDDAGCCLCPAKGGAVKPTTDGGWAHILCALLVPEVFFRDPRGRVGIDCSRVPVRRREEECYLCGTSRGCAIECSEPNCGLGFHVSCGLDEGLCIEYREGKRGDAIVVGFCSGHTQLWRKQQLTGKYKIVPREQNSKGKSRS